MSDSLTKQGVDGIVDFSAYVVWFSYFGCSTRSIIALILKTLSLLWFTFVCTSAQF